MRPKGLTWATSDSSKKRSGYTGSRPAGQGSPEFSRSARVRNEAVPISIEKLGAPVGIRTRVPSSTGLDDRPLHYRGFQLLDASGGDVMTECVFIPFRVRAGQHLVSLICVEQTSFRNRTLTLRSCARAICREGGHIIEILSSRAYLPGPAEARP